MTRFSSTFGPFLACACLPFSSANAAFSLVENFDGLNPGALDGQNGWTADSTFTVVNDPDGGSGQVLQFEAGGQTGAFRALGANAIEDNMVGTLFSRFRFNAEANANFGLSDVAAPGAFGDFEAQINRQNGTPINGRNGSTAPTFLPFDPVADDIDTWYNIWVVSDNGTDTSEVYIQSDIDTTFATQTAVAPVLNFRNGTADPLSTLFLRAQEGTAFFDDFFIAEGTDLSNPAVPEPSTSILTLCGIAIALRRRRVKLQRC